MSEAWRGDAAARGRFPLSRRRGASMARLAMSKAKAVMPAA
jgi:hypothetical protein